MIPNRNPGAAIGSAASSKSIGRAGRAIMESGAAQGGKPPAGGKQTPA